MNETVRESPPAASSQKQAARYQTIGVLRRLLDEADPGTIAALRRANPDGSPPAAFYRLTATVLDELFAEAGSHREAQEEKWAIVVGAMAAAHGFLARVPLGEALANAGVAEMRLVRLLEARGRNLGVLVRTLVHQLVQKGQPFDPSDLADLVLSEGHKPRSRIARSYYRNAT